jgi:hypothetical protein
VAVYTQVAEEVEAVTPVLFLVAKWQGALHGTAMCTLVAAEEAEEIPVLVSVEELLGTPRGVVLAAAAVEVRLAQVSLSPTLAE